MYGHKYTDEEKKFMEEFVPGHSYKEIINAFSEKFGWEITKGRLNAYIANHHLNTGRTGYFAKGHIPPNKGVKGICAPGCEKSWFKKGQLPTNYRPVGSERINRDGYIEIKVNDPNIWKLKHRVIWEKANGEIPQGNIIIFRDNNPINCSLDNLIMIKKRENAIINHSNLSHLTGEYKDTAVILSKLNLASADIKRNRKNK